MDKKIEDRIQNDTLEFIRENPYFQVSPNKTKDGHLLVRGQKYYLEHEDKFIEVKYSEYIFGQYLFYNFICGYGIDHPSDYIYKNIPKNNKKPIAEMPKLRML